jgi:hypothetical protein
MYNRGVNNFSMGCYMSERIGLNSLVGEVLTHVDTDGVDQIMLTTASGRKISIYHWQDCCETVQIVDTEGNWHDLIGKVVIDASESVYAGDPPSEYSDSWTRTDLIFKVDGATLISRWIGESNGYYSESVDISEVKW